MPYIDSTNIQATIKADRYAELTTDSGAIDFAVDTANAELRSILIKEYTAVDDCPDNIRSLGGIVGRYHLYAFNELVDKDDSVKLDYDEALAHLRKIASGEEAGLDDPADDTDNPVRYKSRDRMFDHYFDLS